MQVYISPGDRRIRVATKGTQERIKGRGRVRSPATRRADQAGCLIQDKSKPSLRE